LSETILYLVRHCDVENPANLIYGRLNGFGLSALGRAQAEQVGQYLADRPIVEIYSSPLLRAIQTGRAIGVFHTAVSIRRSLRLIEVRTGYQGMLANDVPSSVNMFDQPRDPTDETMADVFRRMRRFVDAAFVRHRGAEVVCVSHAAPIAILRAGLEGRPFTIDALRGPEAPEKGSITRLTLSKADTPEIQYVDVQRDLSSVH